MFRPTAAAGHPGPAFRHVVSRALALVVPLALAAGCAGAGDPGPARRLEVSSTLSDYNLSSSADGRVRVWARSLAGFSGAHIVESEHGVGGWSSPRPMPFADPRWRDSDPWLTPDGQTLYFISDRPLAHRPGAHDLNIWRVQREPSGGWGRPQPLGDEVNSEAEELGPELHDGVLLFSSNRAGGAGGLDIYRAAQRADGFERSHPLGAPVNSATSESDPTISPDGRTLVFWRVSAGRLVLHAATREGAGWSEPAPLPDRFNPGSQQITPAFTSDGRHLTFATDAAGETDAPGAVGASGTRARRSSTPGTPVLYDLYVAPWR